MMDVLRDTVAVARSLPDFVRSKLARWVVRVHSPIEVDGEAVCPSHWRLMPWPCADVGEAVEYLDTRPARPDP